MGGGEEEVGHGGHRPRQHRRGRQRPIDPLHQLLQLHVLEVEVEVKLEVEAEVEVGVEVDLVLADDAPLLPDVGHALHRHGGHQARQQGRLGVPGGKGGGAGGDREEGEEK